MSRGYGKSIFDIPVISWTMINTRNYGQINVPAYVLERGTQIHQEIQDDLITKIGGYTEISPLIYYKNKILTGHIDMLHSDGTNVTIYEIKSARYYNENKDKVMKQLAFYTFLLESFKQTWKLRGKIIPKVILYTTNGSLQYEIIDIDNIKPYIKEIKKEIEEI